MHLLRRLRCHQSLQFLIARNGAQPAKTLG